MDPVSLQKQIRDNSEDLGKYLGELKLWEKEMKRKEKELCNNDKECEGERDDECLPPVRSKIKKMTASSTCTVAKNALSNKDSVKQTLQQEKSDADKAFGETNNSAADKQPAAINKNIEEALYEKENGNLLVRAGKWKEAMECYSRAVTHDPSNAIFYANRAQCALKLQLWQQVIDDCNSALELEPGYVKALLRRSTAFVKVQDYDSAVEDLSRALTLEPGNKEARSSLAEARKQLSLQPDNSIIVAISKPLHLRSKAPLKRIPIEEVGTGPVPLKQPPTSLPIASASKPTTVNNITTRPIKQEQQRSKPSTPTTPPPPPVESDEVPPAPRSSVQFMLAWQRLPQRLHLKYLLQVGGTELAGLFGDSLESHVLSEVIAALHTSSEEHAPLIPNYLQGLAQARRFSALTLFMSKLDKERVESLIQRSVSAGKCTEDQAHQLRLKYEI